MSHPYINREVKCAFRWYESARLRHRNRTLVSDPDKPTGGTMALAFPYSTILPFQVRCQDDVTSIVSWRMYDLAGTQVYNLDSQIGSLVLAQYATPARTIVCLQQPLIIQALPTGPAFEMQMVTNTGAILYSETFELLCGKPSYSLPNSALSSGTTNWGFGDWFGRVNDVITGAGVPTYSGTDDERVINLTDNLLYTWNGSTWNSSTPVNNTYWSRGVGTQWYIFTGGGWASAVTPPIAPAPDTPYGAVCWNGAYAVPWVYTPPATELPGFVIVNFTPFGGPFAGSINAFAGDNYLGTFTTAQAGIGQEFTVYMYPGDEIMFIPDAAFDGCITNMNFQAIADGTECMTKLDWYNCGDIGTNAYMIGEGLFRNILYLREGSGPISGAAWEPTPVITVSPETNQRGDQIQTRARKDVNWTLHMLNLPWHVIDAVTEIPTVSDAFVRVPWAGGDDRLISPRTETTWQALMLAGDCSMTFQVDEASVHSGCCDNFERPCQEPCGNASAGVYGVDELVVGECYLYDNSTIGTYCSLDCEEPVDEAGFNNIIECPYGIATTSDPLRPLMRWNGTSWVPFAEITSAAGVDEECTSVIVTATMPSGYTGQLESTIDGSTWTALGVGSSAAEFLDGVEVVPPANTMFLRLTVYGADECVLGVSLTVPAPCACPFWDFETNLAENCGDLPATITALFIPYAYEGGPFLGMVALGETVQLWWRINGGSWTAVADVQTTSGRYATNEITYSDGDVLEVRVLPIARSWCTYSVSEEFACV